MELDVRVGNESITIAIDRPFQLDLDALVGRVEAFLASKGAPPNGLDIRGLLPRMVKGIAGCEAGCPADAKGFVSRGSRDFKLEYIEGGILSARVKTANGKDLHIRMFPEF
jgi:hypothetical protein